MRVREVTSRRRRFIARATRPMPSDTSEATIVASVVIADGQTTSPAFDITADDAITNGFEVGSLVALAKLAGVAASFRFFEGTPEFRFGVAGKGFNQGKFGGAVSV